MVTDQRLLRGVLAEELEAQYRKRAALEVQIAKAAPLIAGQQGASESLPVNSQPGIRPGDAVEDLTDEKVAKLRAKALRRAQQVAERLAEVTAVETKLQALLSLVDGSNLAVLRCEIEALGLAERLKTFDPDKAASNQRGRPDGFTGLVLESTRGVPILIGQQSFNDPLLRRIGRGTDLWFQVAEGQGSRVLLRTSMARHLAKSPRECMEMAADLAAHFSDSRHRVWDAEQTVEVMFTDSRHVAKRGTRVGQMKDSKKLGTIWAKPARVADAVREAQEEQGWL